MKIVTLLTKEYKNLVVSKSYNSNESFFSKRGSARFQLLQVIDSF